MEEFKSIKDVVNNLRRNGNLPEQQIYRLIGIYFVLSSHTIRKEISESELYKTGSKDSELSKIALQEHRKYLINRLSKSLRISKNITPQKFKKHMNRLELTASNIKPECVPLDNLYHLLSFLEGNLLTYEEIGREILYGNTRLSKINIY
ncbi:MAG: hypothetical protein ISS82_04040 [Nanoarchaeota archaeon]|nr:hypothetical protein [Nanoarchaeota archaeon]